VALIGHGTESIPPRGWGATERVIWNLHKDHDRHGFDSRIINTTDPRAIVRQLGAFEPDLIHLHAEGLIEALAPYVRARPTPVALTSHDAGLTRSLPPAVERAAPHVDAFFALSPAIRETLAGRGFAPVFYVPNGVDTDRFRPLAKWPNTVLAVGSNRPRKRLPDIAQFFLARPDYQLTICGPETHRADAKHPAIPRGPNITLRGNLEEAELARVFGESEYFVHLSRHEACPLVVREAMAAGCKVWASPVSAQDVKNVARSWEEAVSDPQLGERARREAVERLDWSVIVARTVEVYREIDARWRSR
jgi:glycosyltransferase involved in cell wall biosynthesis